MDALVGAVYLIYDDDDPVTQLKCAAQNEAGLRHGTLRRVNEQNNAVDHFQYALDLAAEVRVTRRVYYIYLRIAVPDGGILCHDGDSALAFKIAGVHDSVHDLLILTVNAGLLEHFVNKRGFAVVNVSDDCDVSKLIHRFQDSLDFL